jgi:hypothetical protein
MRNQAVLTHSNPLPKAGYLQQAWRWLRFLSIIIVINVLLVFLLLEFIIIPYLIDVGDLPSNTLLNVQIPTIPTYTSAIPTYTSATPSPSHIIYL